MPPSLATSPTAVAVDCAFDFRVDRLGTAKDAAAAHVAARNGASVLGRDDLAGFRDVRSIHEDGAEHDFLRHELIPLFARLLG